MILKWLLVCIALVSSPLLAFAQFPANVDSVYTFMKYNSVHRLEVDWQPIDSSFASNIKSAATLEDTMRCFVEVLRALGDVHSQIFLNDQYFGHYAAPDKYTRSKVKSLTKRANDETNHIFASTLKSGYAYIRVPGMQAANIDDINLLATQVYASISMLSTHNRKGFVIDLRLNGGGNLYPMLAGLSPLLGDGVVGYEMTPDDSVARVWELQGSDFVIGGYRATDLAPESVLNLTSLPVAVLIGPVTRSSGSATAIAFKGRPNTILIGEPTADGYTTSNGYFQFAPNLWMNFATTFVADRNKVVYRHAVEPDTVVAKYDYFDLLEADAKIAAAVKWLRKH
ncbi:MAG: S41 family peptidase [bacterium]|nr:S41 family peptidase [bacterium]